MLGACSKTPIRETPVDPIDTTSQPVTYTKGIFVINEGNFNWGNASVCFIDQSTNNVYPDIFKASNQRSLGDVAQSMTRFKDYGLIVVNNSSRIEVVSLKDFKTVTSVSGFTFPRYMEIVDSTKAYVTSLKKNIAVLDLTSFTITKEIPVPAWTEVLARYDHYMYVTCVGTFNESNAKRKSKVYIIDTQSDLIIDSITTGKEPLGIAIDKKEKIWILCTGGYDFFESPSLVRIDPTLRIVEKVFTFPNDGNLPKKLCSNATRDTLYFIKDGIYQMPVSSLSLPDQPLIPADGRVFYGLAINPADGSVFVSDAIDYVQNGTVYQYNSSNGKQIHSYKVGRIPAAFCFIK
jgi:DNA-binding beta-propeller fold protein YncE